MNYLKLLVFTVFVLFTTAINAEQRLRIHGSNTVGSALAPALIENWLTSKGYTISVNQLKNPEERLITANKPGTEPLTVELVTYGSSSAFQDLAAGKTDIGISSRPIKSEELTKLAPLGKLDSIESEYVITLDGIAIIVHPSNPISTINKDTLRRIFAGDIRKWSSLGIKNSVDQITVYSRHNESGTFDTFKNLVLEEKYPLTPTAKRVESNSKLAESVVQDPAGIGFVGYAYVGKNKVLAVAEGLAKPVSPSAFEIGTEDYVLSRRLYLYIPQQNPHPLAREFAQYAISPTAQQTAAKLGFISQDLIDNAVTVPTVAPDEYKQLTQRAKRLSMNIRFQQSEVKPDNKAIRDIERLTHYLAKPANKGRKIMLFGFADTHETSPYSSLMLSTERADAVADYLIRHGVAPLRVRGFGQELPVADNSSANGRNRNRRVEIWIQ